MNRTGYGLRTMNHWSSHGWQFEAEPTIALSPRSATPIAQIPVKRSPPAKRAHPDFRGRPPALLLSIDYNFMKNLLK
jgi:hypothetical protein